MSADSKGTPPRAEIKRVMAYLGTLGLGTPKRISDKERLRRRESMRVARELRISRIRQRKGDA